MPFADFALDTFLHFSKEGTPLHRHEYVTFRSGSTMCFTVRSTSTYQISLERQGAVCNARRCAEGIMESACLI